jgi:hypothetical protein
MIQRRLLWPFHGNVSAQFTKLGFNLDYSDFTLTVIMLALYSCLWPYRGIVHDARYYALQALNNAKNGHFAHDLFLEFGSQDNYSVFSHVMGPLTARLGLDVAFGLAYMAAMALCIYGVVRFLRCLIPDRSLANLGVLMIIAMPILYGGSSSFRILENFYTARLVSQGFGLLGLEAIYRKRSWKAMGFALVSMAFHPIMGIGSLLVIAAIFLKDRVHSRLAVCTALLLFIGAPLFLLLLKWNLIGPLISSDVEWYALVKRRSLTCFPLQWAVVDWCRMVGAIVIIWGCCRFLEPRAKMLAGMIALTGIVGILSSVLGELLSCPILVQGQGYRAFWQVQMLAMPLFFFALIRYSSRVSIEKSWAALGIFLLLWIPFFIGKDGEWIAYILFQMGLYLIIFFFLFKGTACNRGGMIPLWLCVLASVVGLSLVVFSGIIHASVGNIASVASALMKMGSRGFVFFISLWILYLFSLVLKTPRSVTVFSLTVWLSLSFGLIMVGQSFAYKEHLHPGYKDVHFIAEVIKQAKGKFSEPANDTVIYWPECSELIWFDLQANSYYSYSQLAGVVFSKDTILEASRRAALVKPFEVAALRGNNKPSDKQKRMSLSFLKSSMQEPAPTRESLIRLAKETNLDWIILNIGFERLYTAANRFVYIYDCSRIRQMNAASASNFSE